MRAGVDLAGDAILDAVGLRGATSADEQLLTALGRVRAAHGRFVDGPVELLPKAWRAWVLRAHLDRLVPHIDIPDLLAEVEGWTGFTGQLTHAAGATPRISHLQQHLLAALLSSGLNLGGLVAASLALRDASRVLSLTLVASAGLGEEINGEYVERFVSASSRRELRPALELVFADGGQVTRQLVDDVLKYKRIDGVDAALRSLADQIFGAGQQQVFLADRLAQLEVPLLVVWGAEDRIIPPEHARHVPKRRTCLS